MTIGWAEAEQLNFVGVPLRYRVDGWTPPRQRAFLDALAEGLTVEQACRLVGLSESSAYALRKRAAGASFAIGWHAAVLHARVRLADRLYSRALDGYAETVTRPDGSVTMRHKFDNRLAMAMLTRLDKLAEDGTGGGVGRAARAIEQELDQYLDVVEQGDAMEAAIFVGQRLVDNISPEVTTMAALRSAERHLREADMPEAPEDWAGGDGAGDDADWDDIAAAPLPDVAGLVPAERQGWTADEWARALAAGLVAATDPPDSVTNPPVSQLPPPAEAPWQVDSRGRQVKRAAAAPPPPQPQRFYVWRIAAEAPDRIWYTCFPPPEGFDGLERGIYGDDDYWRSCTVAEAAGAEAALIREVEERRARDAALYDSVFPKADAATA